MIATDTLISNLITHFKAFSWTSNSGHGTTKFQDVFNFEHNSHDKGYPYMYVDDQDGSHETFTNKHMEGDVIIKVAVCTKWDIVDLSNIYTEEQLATMSDYEKQVAQRSEGTTRLREAWNATKANLAKTATLDAMLGSQKSWLASMNFSTEDIEELNLLRRIATLTLKEYLAR